LHDQRGLAIKECFTSSFVALCLLLEQDGPRGWKARQPKFKMRSKQMRSKTWKTWTLFAIVGMAIPVLGQSGITQDKKSQLVGTWQVQVTQVDCSSGAQLGPPFTSMLTFAADGTMAEDTSNPGFGHGQRGGGQGRWSGTGQSTYAATSGALIKYTTKPNQKTHNPGLNAGQQTISQNITLDTQSGKWNSTASVAFADANGNVYRTGCAIAAGTPF
jgi:hypothetical protein